MQKPVIQVDYTFFRSENQKDEEKVPVLCCYNVRDQAGAATMVLSKGPTDAWNEKSEILVSMTNMLKSCVHVMLSWLQKAL